MLRTLELPNFTTQSTYTRKRAIIDGAKRILKELSSGHQAILHNYPPEGARVALILDLTQKTTHSTATAVGQTHWHWVSSGHRCALFRCDRCTFAWADVGCTTLLVMSACDCWVCRVHSYCWLSFGVGYDLSCKSLQLLGLLSHWTNSKLYISIISII